MHTDSSSQHSKLVCH